MNTHCEETYSEWLLADGNYDEAKKACDEDPSCGGLVDTVCGDGFFELCKKGSRFISNEEVNDLWISDSCVWIKQGIYGLKQKKLSKVIKHYCIFS